MRIIRFWLPLLIAFNMTFVQVSYADESRSAAVSSSLEELYDRLGYSLEQDGRYREDLKAEALEEFKDYYRQGLNIEEFKQFLLAKAPTEQVKNELLLNFDALMISGASEEEVISKTLDVLSLTSRNTGSAFIGDAAGAIGGVILAVVFIYIVLYPMAAAEKISEHYSEQAEEDEEGNGALIFN